MIRKLSKKLKLTKPQRKYLKQMLVLDNGKEATFISYCEGKCKNNEFFTQKNSYKVEITDELKLLINDILIQNYKYKNVKFL